MIIVPHQNAAGSKPVVTSTATAIFDLINTAASTNLPYAGFDAQVDSIDITPENGSVRVMYDGNTPTASNGQLLYEDVTYHFRGIDLLKLKLIRTGGSDVTCNAVLGRATAGEVSSSGGNSVAGSGGGGGGGAVTIADGDDAALGAKADAAASSDTGTFSLIALFKRLLQGMTTLNAKDFATQTTLAALNTKVTAVNTGAVTVSSSALPTGAATEATLSTLDGKVTACNTGAVTVSSSALPTGAATETTLGTRLSESDFDTKTGSLTETAPATDTASSGLNGRLQRIAQRLTSLIALLPTALGAGGGLKVSGDTAHDAVDAGEPLKIGAKAVDPTSLPTAVAANDRSNLYSSLQGELLVYLSRLLAGEDQTNTVMQSVEKPLAVSTYAPDMDTSTAAEASSVTKASAGNLYSFTATNSSGSARYLQFFNSTTVPADTTVPVLSYYVAAGGTIADSWSTPRYFSTGISWAWSSTAATKTVGSTDGIADVRYK